MEGQREKARAKSAFKGGAARSAWNVAGRPRPASSTAVGDQSSAATTRPSVEHAGRWRCSTPSTGSRSTALAAGEQRLRRAGARRRSTSRPAARCPTSGTIARSAAARPQVDGVLRRRRTGRACTRVTVTEGALQHARPRHRRGRRDGARRDAAQSHGDAPAARRAAPGARAARQAGRLAGRAGSPALRLRPLQRADAASSCSRSSGSSTSRC